MGQVFEIATFGASIDLGYRDRSLTELVSLSLRTGWSLDYLEKLNVLKLRRIQAILDGLDESRSFINKNPKAFG